MATYAYTFASGDTITPQRLNDARTVSAIVNADISASADIAGSKLADSGITLAKLAASLQELLVPAGTVASFARSTAPSGWLIANGDTVGGASSNATHAAAGYESLYTVLWSNFTDAQLPILTSGGSASTRGASASADFSASKRLTLPDLRGIFVRGSGSQTISTISFSGTFGNKQTDDLKAHTHTYTRYTALREGLGAGAGNGWASASTDSTGSTPTSGGTETRPANIALLYCIKY